MTLPFAVYTAWEGYGWATDLGSEKNVFEKLRQKIGKSPDVEMGDALFAGAVNSGDNVIVYKFLKAIEWDSKKRDALYLVMTFFTRSEAKGINFQQLLSLPWFTETIRNPPITITYESTSAIGIDFDFPTYDATGDLPPGKDMSCAGFLFSKAFDGVFKVRQENNNTKIRWSYIPAVLVDEENHKECTDYASIQDIKIPLKNCWDWEKIAASIAIPLSIVMFFSLVTIFRVKHWNRNNVSASKQVSCSKDNFLLCNLNNPSNNLSMQLMPFLYGYYNWSKTNLITRQRER